VSLRLYMDHHVRRAITNGLRLRGVDVIAAQDDGTTRLPDPQLLDRATTLGRTLFSQDRDLLRESARRQAAGEHFAGVIFAEQLGITIGQCINDLELIATVYEPEDIADRVEYLPL
jgi:predicted nuclease of predicted toxin-antitoxin system